MKAKIQNDTKNNIIIGLSVLAVSLLVIFSFSGVKASGGLLGADEFIAKYKSTPNAILVDVRTPDEFNAGHIAGAANIDFEKPNFEQEVQKMDASKAYFIYCRSGNRSSKAAVAMKRYGIQTLYELQGGISSAPRLLTE